MKKIFGLLAGMGALGIVCYFLFGAIGLFLYGIYLAFSASILLGVVVLFVEPSPFVIGAVMFFFHKDLAQALMDFLNK